MKSIKIIPPKGPLSADIHIPGSKSYTNRALIIAAMTEGSVDIENPLFSDDTHALINILKNLGIAINITDDKIIVSGSYKDIKDGNYYLNANLSGTTIRFILPFLCITPGKKILEGNEGLNKRPIKILADALIDAGADIKYKEKEGYPPLLINYKKLDTSEIALDSSVSSQYISSLLMCAPICGIRKISTSNAAISRPYIDMTIDIMRNFGVNVENKNYREFIIKEKQKYNTQKYIVEGDFSSAGYFFAIAALTGSKFKLRNLNPNSSQADKKLIEVLEFMGSTITPGENCIEIKGGGVKAIEWGMIDFPDQAQTVAVLASFARGITVLKGVASLRIKETERVKAVETELAKMGIKTESTNDTLRIYGGAPEACTIDTYNDHRMAMSFAVAGCKTEGIVINNADVVNKTFPDFWEKLNQAGVKTMVMYDNIFLTGMRGSGKSTIGKYIANYLSKEFVDTDKIIEKNTGYSIADFVKKFGWGKFREMESDVISQVSKSKNTVVATGGGVVLDPENIKRMKQSGIIVFLNTPVKTLAERIAGDKNRPPLTEKTSIIEEVSETYKKRVNIYRDSADLIFSKNHLNEADSAREITAKLKKIVL